MLRRHSKTLSFLVLLIVCGNYVFIGRYYFNISIKPKTDYETAGISLSSKYFLTEAEYDSMGYLVKTPQCTIPAIEPWNPSIIPLINKIGPIDCKKETRHWTYVNKTMIMLNETSIKYSGYTLDQISCCYRSIRRDGRHLNSVTGWFSSVVDSRVTYSENCKPLDLVTEPDSEFIFVTCEPRNFYWYFHELLTTKTIYKNYHALVPARKNDEISIKVNYWKGIPWSSHESRPPSVIVIGLDSTSRLHFQRSMPRTIRILKEIGSHELQGYTKVGDNTWPNIIPLLTGYDDNEFGQICWPSSKAKLDECPFIWKRFSEAKYLTAEIQDFPRLNHWNFQKTGFVQPPTSFYFRPFIVGVHMNAGFYPHRVECIGYQTMEEVMLGYIKDLIQFSDSMKTPLFLMSWFSQLGHDSLNALQFGDSTFSNVLGTLQKEGALDNTVLILTSDHGYRHGRIRETLAGYYEEKLPTTWIRLPAWLSKRYPKWETSLQENTRQLSSTFDLYKTLSHVLGIFTNTSETPARLLADSNPIQRTLGQSLFEPIPVNRSCEEAGIPEVYCACNLPIRLSPESGLLRRAAVAAVHVLNGQIPKQCSTFVLAHVKGGALLSKVTDDNMEDISSFIVKFTTMPGEFVFEAKGTRQSNSTPEFEVGHNILRLSQFTTDVSCVHNSVDKLYCYCLQ